MGGMDRVDLLSLYRQMLLIRRFEEKSAEMYALAKIAGFLHLYIGEEAIAVGAVAALRPDDYVISAYRDHGHCLARGSDPGKVMAELFGKATGLCQGKGGSMHLVDAPNRFMGGYAIVGGHIPLATGLAFAAKYQKQDLVTVCFFGEGAVPSGQAHEAFNLAALWKLPVIFICENNRYGMGTPVERAIALYADVVETARSYGIMAERVDGMDVLAVRSLMRTVVDQVRAGHGPFFIEAMTYRFMGHSMADPAHGHYRTKEEVEEHRRRDPLRLLKDTILRGQLGTEADFKQLEQEVGDRVAAAVKFADESPFPSPAALHTDILVEGEV
ncbi:pyruvate dehydrogenase (acetyl-transferring) E1 component subunit alpha [Nitrospirales bacterium NOB]|nr:Acetoin:2,6-dichlorophenolindophenol oxidoreductase subunit alpha [Nitrospirota bacterium]MCE7966274.1 pyruvate dehydrogenase (acetyl-transferring) E1 component subunit alpha [Nitrospira sp. NTP2]MDL1891005.1 pyruvate dehydrogenase (acetyl-transferring) E1 component subunit alpha [Nitrospirales bacterium NOB]QOJ35818.1 MAG: pyruvate dehydrogenase (acetyl-transferring) E1 component subunit alpha [Nitrospira sp.]RIK60639.1 MAG: pyruvate dehydrogenase (acetyl-transferring) E1 component subunit 